MGHEPRALPLLSQARLTFLAFAGVTTVVDEAASEKSCRALGLSPASGALFHGIALARSGQVERAQTELRRVEEVAGPRDDRTVAASHDAISRLGEAAVELGPELSRYAQAVAERLRGFLERGPGIRHHETPWATPSLMVALALGYAAPLLANRGGMGLLEVGALTPELWRSGSWGRLLTGSFVQADLIGLLLNMYGLWLGGSVVERATGPVRLSLLALASGAVGLAVAAGMYPDASAPLAGGNVLSFGVTVAAFWLLLTGRTPALSKRVRRGLAIPLGLVIIAHMLASVAHGDAMDVPAVGLAAAFAVAVAFVSLLPTMAATRLARLLRWTLVAVLGVTAAALVDVAAEDVEGFALAHRDQRIEHEGVKFRVPGGFSLREAGPRDQTIIPAQTGLYNELEARADTLVQILVVKVDPVEEGATRDEPVLFVADPKLTRELGASELSELPAALLAAFGPNPPLRAFALRRNGVTVAQVVERELSPGLMVVLVAAPAEALTHAPGLYGAILADAAVAQP
jgi:membrane associated rhomboid family serine protease